VGCGLADKSDMNAFLNEERARHVPRENVQEVAGNPEELIRMVSPKRLVLVLPLAVRDDAGPEPSCQRNPTETRVGEPVPWLSNANSAGVS